MINQTLTASSDGAAWYLFHPADLAHRRRSPMAWPADPAAISAEYAAGNLVAVGTKADSSWRIRFTDQGLTAAEQAHALVFVDFRLWVRHQRVCLDGDDNLPFWNEWIPPEQQPDLDAPPATEPDAYDIDPSAWLELPNGKYHVRVYTFDWKEQRQNDSPAYTVVLTPVESFEAVPFPSGMPDLVEEEGLYEPRLKRSTGTPQAPPDNRERAAPPAMENEEYALFVWEGGILPKLEVQLPLSQSEYKQVRNIINTSFKALRGLQIVICKAPEPNSLGTLMRFRRLSSGQEPMLSGTVIKPVRLLSVEERDGTQWATVEPVEPE